jgi:hypothetical protein
MRFYSKVPEIRLAKLKHFSKYLFGPLHFEVVPFWVNTAIQAEFPLSEVLLEDTQYIFSSISF